MFLRVAFTNLAPSVPQSGFHVLAGGEARSGWTHLFSPGFSLVSSFVFKGCCQRFSLQALKVLARLLGARGRFKQRCELLCAPLCVRQAPYPRAKPFASLALVLRASFHGCLPGTSAWRCSAGRGTVVVGTCQHGGAAGQGPPWAFIHVLMFWGCLSTPVPFGKGGPDIFKAQTAPCSPLVLSRPLC